MPYITETEYNNMSNKIFKLENENETLKAKFRRLFPKVGLAAKFQPCGRHGKTAKPAKSINCLILLKSK